MCVDLLTAVERSSERNPNKTKLTTNSCLKLTMTLTLVHINNAPDFIHIKHEHHTSSNRPLSAVVEPGGALSADCKSNEGLSVKALT